MTNLLDKRSPVSRRTLLKTACATVLLGPLPAIGKSAPVGDVTSALAELEAESGGRLGVAIVDLGSGDAVGHRLDERFGMCSTFKLPLAAIILMEADTGRLDLDAPVHYTADDMVFYAPVTEKHLERGYMSVLELAKATQITSDNVAANLLLGLIGGPKGFTAKLRGIGDDTTRLDRLEPEMNLVPPGELRDTTTPEAMAQTVRRLLYDELLSADHRLMLVDWMMSTKTGRDRLRAGFPGDWRAGDKTGTGIAASMPNKYNDVAVAWPDDGEPGIVVAAYYEADGHYERMRDEDVAVLRKVGEIVAGARMG